MKVTGCLTHLSSEEDLILRLVQYCHDDNRVSSWVGDVMQPFPDEDKVGESLNAKRERDGQSGTRSPTSIIRQ